MSSAASLPSLPRTPNNLPLQLTSFVGRKQEILEVKQLLRVSRLLTLTGAGGSGKTRLALQVAFDVLDDPEDYDGVYFVSLAPISDHADLIAYIAQILDVRESPGLSLEESLKAYLRDRHLLLLLDNFEHIVEAAPRLVDLLGAAPDVRAVVTSRASLRVSGEQQYPVPSLGLPDLEELPDPEALSEVEAVSLFVQRAASAKPQFTLAKENSPAVAEICYRLDGLPLAIELAAARVNVLNPQAMLEMLKHNLNLLSGGGRDLPARHRTLRAAIDWSYNLLDGQEKKLFRRMSVFVGGQTLEAVEAVCTDDGETELDALDGVASLVNKSLIRPQDRAGKDAGGPRFQMLETIREYARERLQESGEAEALHKKHAVYFMKLVEEVEPRLEGKQQHALLDSLEEDHDNVRAALHWAAGRAEAGRARTDAAAALEIGLRTAGALRDFWDVRCKYSEGREYLQRLVSQSERLSSSREVRVKALNAAGILAYRQGEYEAARLPLEQALELGRELGNKQSMALSLHHLGNAALEQSKYEAARALYQESLALREERGDTLGIAICLHNLGSVALMQGDYSTGQSLYDESLSLFRKEEEKWYIAAPLIGLGTIAYAQGDYSTARSYYVESLATGTEVRSKLQIAISIAGLGEIAVATGELQKGARLLFSADALLKEIGSVLESEDRRLYEAAMASVRSQLGEGALEEAKNYGQAMTLEQSLAYALDPTLRHEDESPGPSPVPASAPAPKKVMRSRYPQGLTRREVEVLRVAALGLTNAQIAERLFLSPNTVNVHLYSIYSKLGVNSRSAATRFAMEHNLH